MALELVLVLILGLLAGTITGLTPGIHINLLTTIISSSIFFSKYSPTSLIIFIVSLSITHTFLDFIPSVYVGAPDEDTFLSVLPGHEMLKEGSAHEAVVLTLYGSLTALIIIAISSPVILLVLPEFYSLFQISLPFLLIFLSCYFLLREKDPVIGIVVFLLAGFLGFFSLNLPIDQPLLPLLTGLFGSSAILISLNNKPQIPFQRTPRLKEIKLERKEFTRAFIGATISAPFCSYFPGIGSGHAAIIGSETISQTKKGFIFLLGAINTIVIGVSFLTLYSIGKTRTGSAVAIQKLIPDITYQLLFTIVLTIIISSLLAFPLAIAISKKIAKNLKKINYSKISLAVLSLLLIVNLIFTNFLGLLVSVTATALGIFTIKSNIRRVNLMGCLLIPTIIFYLAL